MFTWCVSLTSQVSNHRESAKRDDLHDNALSALTVVTSSVLPMGSRPEHTSNYYPINIVVSCYRWSNIMCVQYHEKLCLRRAG